ncbi:MAG TPA: gliding motility-associated C-terminal domain-containing protein, partial [Bacteroidia bacterium]|nr:gliding motility-associated C-terminal domain-containing protein [Bacteroidia bacterium]
DRWGNKVFESTDPNVGWDGKYDGKPMNTGTYVYYVNVLTTDNKNFTKKGNVTLVR